jgi:hypothetical protein
MAQATERGERVFNKFSLARSQYISVILDDIGWVLSIQILDV